MSPGVDPSLSQHRQGGQGGLSEGRHTGVKLSKTGRVQPGEGKGRNSKQ